LGESTGVLSEGTKSSMRSSIVFQRTKSSLTDSTYRPTPNATKEVSDYLGLPIPRMELKVRLEDASDLLRNSALNKGLISANAVQISPRYDCIATACSDGAVRLYNSKGRQRANMNSPYTQPKHLRHQTIVGTCVRWRKGTDTRPDICVSGDSTGRLYTWDCQRLMKLHTMDVSMESVLALDYNVNFKNFVVGGVAGDLKLYDETSKTLVSYLKKLDRPEERRCTAVKFHPREQFQLVSASWSNAVEYWDTRAPSDPVASFFGPYVCRESLDFSSDGYTVVTGSCREEEQIQLWDVRRPDLPTNVWNLPRRACGSAEMIATTQFMRWGDQDVLLIGGSKGVFVCSPNGQVLSSVPCENEVIACHHLDGKVAIAQLGEPFLELHELNKIESDATMALPEKSSKSSGGILRDATR